MALWFVAAVAVGGHSAEQSAVEAVPIQEFPHARAVRAVAFSLDGSALLTACADGWVRLWDMTTGGERWAIEAHPSALNALALSPDGTRFLTGGNDAMAKLWDTTTGGLVLSFYGHLSMVEHVAFSADGTRCLTASHDGTARVWSATSGTEICTLAGHKGVVSSAAFSPDANLVLTGSWDGTARLWNATTAETVRTLNAHKEQVWAAVFSPDGTKVLTGGQDQAARLWDTDTGKEIRAFSEHGGPVLSVAFSPDGATIVTASDDKSARLWDIATGQLIRRFAGHRQAVESVAFSPDGKKIATGSADGTAKVWSVAPQPAPTAPSESASSETVVLRLGLLDITLTDDAATSLDLSPQTLNILDVHFWLPTAPSSATLAATTIGRVPSMADTLRNLQKQGAVRWRLNRRVVIEPNKPARVEVPAGKTAPAAGGGIFSFESQKVDLDQGLVTLKFDMGPPGTSVQRNGDTAFVPLTAPTEIEGKRTVALALITTELPALGGAAGVVNYAGDLAAFLREIDTTYPFFDLKGIRDDWKKTKTTLNEKIKTCQTDEAFLEIVDQAIRCLRDGHLGFRQLNAKTTPPPPQFYPGISFLPATEGRVAVMFPPPNADPALKTGAVVARIDGSDARQFLEQQAAAGWKAGGYFSSPQRTRLFAYRIPLMGEQGERHTITILTNGQEREIELASDQPARGWPHTYNMPGGLARSGRSCWYGKLASGVGYIYLSSVDGGTGPGLKKAFAARPDARGWIIDLCGNGGGGYDEALYQALRALPRPLAGIIDAGTFSAGETLARDLVQYGNARLFGSATAGSSTSKRMWQFPSGIGTLSLPRRSHGGLGKPIEFFGIEPHVEVEAVPEELQKGRNSAILRAEEYLTSATKNRVEEKRERPPEPRRGDEDTSAPSAAVVSSWLLVAGC